MRDALARRYASLGSAPALRSNVTWHRTETESESTSMHQYIILHDSAYDWTDHWSKDEHACRLAGFVHVGAASADGHANSKLVHSTVKQLAGCRVNCKLLKQHACMHNYVVKQHVVRSL